MFCKFLLSLLTVRDLEKRQPKLPELLSLTLADKVYTQHTRLKAKTPDSELVLT